MSQISVTQPSSLSRQTASVFDMEGLAAIEAMCHSCINQEPENTSARLRLAWCLVVRAFHEAGQESALTQIDADKDRLEAVGKMPLNAPDLSGEESGEKKTATQLLRSSLKQTMMVTQLSTNPSERKEAESLQRLVTMSGGKQAVVEVNEESNHIFAEIAQALMKFDGDQTGVQFLRNLPLAV